MLQLVALVLEESKVIFSVAFTFVLRKFYLIMI